MAGKIYKLGSHHDGVDREHVYPDLWDREGTTGADRLIVAPASNHCAHMVDLAALWSEDYFVLYVLLVSRTGADSGRYECPHPLSIDEVRDFFGEYGAYLNSDGRHHVWIGSPSAEGMLVYDQHNVIYAYGPLDAYERSLTEKGFHRGPVGFPSPHTHLFHAANDEAETRILRHWRWTKKPLQDGDEY